MTPKKRRILLATVASLLGMTAAIPMIVSSTASAQTNSRICGRKYTSTDSSFPIQEVVYRIYDTPKADELACFVAQDGSGRTVHDSGFTLVNGSWDGDGIKIGSIKCEDFMANELGGMPLMEEAGQKFDQKDICNNMERSGSVGEMRSYFLYSKTDKDHPETDTKKWLFKKR